MVVCQVARRLFDDAMRLNFKNNKFASYNSRQLHRLDQQEVENMRLVACTWSAWTLRAGPAGLCTRYPDTQRLGQLWWFG